MSYPDYEEMRRYWDEKPRMSEIVEAIDWPMPPPPQPPETTISELASDLRAMGVEGRHVMVHASYKLLAPVEGGPAGVVDAFVEAVGNGGELLFPTFDFESWSEHGYWDRDNSRSRMGAITEAARSDWKFERTFHPMLSFAVLVFQRYKSHWGKDLSRCPYFAPTVEGLPINAHGAGSVFDRFIQNDGLLLSVGADKQTGFKPEDVGFTASVHAFVEAGVDWRIMKLFRGVYVDGGVATVREYAASVTKDPKRHQTAVTPGHLEAERLGIIKRVKLGRTECWLASARDFHAFCVESCVKQPELWRKKR